MMDHALNDARDAHTKTHEWINSLIVAGVSEQAAVTGALQALIERVLLSSDAPKTARFLRHHARQIEKGGDELIKALKG